MDDTVCASGSMLADCTYAGWGTHNCVHSEDSGVTCSGTRTFQRLFWDMPVRLVDGGASHQGRLEVYRAATASWGSVCDDGFSDDGARVFCIALGFPLGGYFVVPGTFP
jgi:hypothetical protein